MAVLTRGGEGRPLRTRRPDIHLMATRYIAGRVLAMVPVLFIVSVVVSLMVHLTPGDPVKVMMGQSGASAEEIEQIRVQLGLDKPLPVQYVRFLQDLATGNLRSIRTHQPVVQQYLELFPNTLQLAVVSLLVATVIGMLLGVVAATHQNSWLDSFSMAVGFLGVSIPNFWLALVLIYVFAVSLNWLPATGAGGPKLLILPAAVLAMEQVALIARLIRANMVEVLQEDYIKTARSKGLRESSVQWRPCAAQRDATDDHADGTQLRLPAEWGHHRGDGVCPSGDRSLDRRRHPQQGLPGGARRRAAHRRRLLARQLADRYLVQPDRSAHPVLALTTARVVMARATVTAGDVIADSSS